jgi:sporulation protein YlmC with PRC-barrel domain
MHVRFSTAAGLPIVEEGSDEAIGAVSGILLHPDTGKVEGVFSRQPRPWGFGKAEDLFLASQDILHWGTAIRVRSADSLSPIDDRIRLRSLLEDGRSVLGQGMVTEGGRRLGTCADVQFDTRHFQLEWLFPKAWLRWGTPVPASAIVEVRPDVILIRDPLVTVPQASLPVLSTFDRLTDVPAPRTMDA